MSIYKPVSSATRGLLGISGSILSGVSNAIGNKIIGAVSSQTSNKIIQGAVNSAIQTGVSMANNEITRRVSNPLMQTAQSLDTRLKNIARKGLKTFGLNAFDNQGIKHNTIPHAGGLSILDAWENYKHTNPSGLSHKNFYVLEINDRSPNAPTSNGDKHSMFNLLTTNLQFTSIDIQGETVQLGSVEADRLSANARTVINLTVIDDKLGTIKRWCEQKAFMMASPDGTFMPPAYYCFEVRIVFGTNIADARFYEQIYTMRLQTMPHELTRQEQGLEELQLTFAQTDAFMPHWI